MISDENCSGSTHQAKSDRFPLFYAEAHRHRWTNSSHVSRAAANARWWNHNRLLFGASSEGTSSGNGIGAEAGRLEGRQCRILEKISFLTLERRVELIAEVDVLNDQTFALWHGSAKQMTMSCSVRAEGDSPVHWR